MQSLVVISFINPITHEIEFKDPEGLGSFKIAFPTECENWKDLVIGDKFTLTLTKIQ